MLYSQRFYRILNYLWKTPGWLVFSGLVMTGILLNEHKPGEFFKDAFKSLLGLLMLYPVVALGWAAYEQWSENRKRFPEADEPYEVPEPKSPSGGSNVP
jgi:hypothetical protein